MNEYCLYYHYTADTNSLFYIGKGRTKFRPMQKSRRNKWWLNIVKKHGLRVEIVQDNISEEEAFRLEIEMIALNRKLGANLCNLTTGGEGASGRAPWNKGKTHSEESILKMRRVKLGKKLTDAHRQKLIDQLKNGKADQISKTLRPTLYPTLVDANGKEYTVNNLTAFCRTHNIDQRKMNCVVNGTRLSHRGWHIKGLDISVKARGERNALKQRPEGWGKIVSPAGEIYNVINMAAFAKEHNLQSKGMRDMFYGGRKQHKGWRIYNG